MKRIFFALALVISTVLALLPNAARSQVPGQPGKGLPFDLGPGDKGATLKAPWLETGSASIQTPAASTNSPPSYIQNLLQETGAVSSGTTTSTNHTSLLPYDNSVNKDILVTREVGPWMILIISYAGPEGPIWARDMVRVLREQFKLPAYVFNYGAEEKRKEYVRVKGIIDQQKQALKDKDLPPDTPLRVRHLRIDEHCGVLLGGYATQEAALKVRDHLKNNVKFPDPDKVKVKLEVQFYERQDDAPDTPQRPKKEAAYVNPFTRALVVPNPAIKLEKPPVWDIAALRRMNAEEDFSLLKCKRNYTLVIKQFNLPSITAHRSETQSGFWDSFGMGKKKDQIDAVAETAHNLVEGLRKSKLEAYVLHTKYYSLVTVGGFDSKDDPNMRSMQSVIEAKLLPAQSLAELQLFPKAMPMEIPK
jgi:hypothetical protein